LVGQHGHERYKSGKPGEAADSGADAEGSGIPNAKVAIASKDRAFTASIRPRAGRQLPESGSFAVGTWIDDDPPSPEKFGRSARPNAPIALTIEGPSKHHFPVANTALRIEVAGETNVGMKRNHNEDCFSIFEENGLYVVADGMGGHASGEVASKMAVDSLQEFFAATAEDPERTWPYKMDRTRGYEENRLITGIKLANLRIYESAQRDSKQRGMGTTLVSLFAVEDGVYVGHVGDSRVYRVRDGQIEQLTEDHSLLNDYIKMKRLTAEEIANFPHKNVIVRALGMKDTVKVDTRFETPKEGDVYVMCSDGLSGPVDDAAMLEIVLANTDIKVAATKLIAKANENGGPDNITVVIARWVA
jgi:serine/threonine protein phosphatase PrpC